MRGLLTLGLLLGALGCAPATPTPIALGHIADQSAADRAGEYQALGIRLALSELKDELPGALNGRPVQVRHADTRGEADAYGAEAVRLVTINRALGLIG